MDAIVKLIPFTREPSFLDKAWMAVRYPVDLVASPIKAIVSIPALSFLVIPAFSSYGTSINLLFFYMTWAILIRSNDPIQIELLGVLGVRVLFYLIPSFGFLAFDSASPTLALSIKEHGESALPMCEEEGSPKGRWWKVALLCAGNVLLSVALQIGLELLFTRVLHVRSLLKITTSIPFPWSIAKDLLLGLGLRELLTYGLHRYALHSGQSPFTTLHESWQHSLRAPYSLVAHYDHPLAYLIHVFLPMYLPAVLFRFHLLTYQVYLILISLEETFAYSGYNVLPSAFTLGGIARRQEKHLMGGGDGNYGCIGLADVLMGTSLGTDLVDDVIDEAEDNRPTKLVKGQARAAGKKASKTPKRVHNSVDDHGRVFQDDEYRNDRQSTKGLDSRKPTRREDIDDNEDATGEETDARSENPLRKSGRTRRTKSDDNLDAGEEERPKAKSNNRSFQRKENQKSKSGSRPRKRVGVDD